MPKLIEWRRTRAAAVADAFTFVADDEEIPAGDVIVSLARFHAEGERLIGEGRLVGVRVAAGEEVESLAYDLPSIAVVELEFPKFKDGRSYSAARILRERFGYQGQVRAVGDVLLEQANFMIRCGFDAFEPADGTGAKDWTAAGTRYRHVYQRAADDREPAFALRSATFAPSTHRHPGQAPDLENAVLNNRHPGQAPSGAQSRDPEVKKLWRSPPLGPGSRRRTARPG